MKKIAGNCYSSDTINVKQLIPLIYCLYTRGKNIIFGQLKKIANLASLFRQRTFITFLVGLFLRAVGRKRIFLFGRFMACINTTYMRNFKIICQGEVCKTDKLPSLFPKTLKNMTPTKDGK